jgi:hypothetical protein
MRSVPYWISYLHANSWIYNPFIAILIKFLKSKTDIVFPNFDSKSILNMEKVVPFLKTLKSYFISDFSSLTKLLLE